MSFSSVRRFATAAAAKSPLVINKNRILASVILSRSPQITRDATPFERAYFDYKEKLERQQASRFPTEFYFKKGSLAERRWKEEEAARQAAMNDPNQSLTEAVLKTQASFQDETSARSNLVQASRVTDADKNNDLKSLDRALQRTLYLVVRQSEGGDRWIFPQGQLESSEYLHEVKTKRKPYDISTCTFANSITAIYRQLNVTSSTTVDQTWMYGL